MKFVVNDVEYYVEVKGDGFPLVLLHGFTGDHSTWSDFVSEIQNTRRIISVDLLGHGLTSSPNAVSRYGMEAATRDLHVILQRLNITETDMIGYSMGGRLALAYAVQYPDSIRRLVLESASPGLEMDRERTARRHQDEALALLIEERGIDWFVDYWGNIPLFQSQKKLPVLVQERIKEQRKQNSSKGLANSLRGMGTGIQPSYWEQLSVLDIPVLLITGAEDEKFVRIAQQMQEILRNGLHLSIEDCGHAIHVEKPEKFGTIVSGFLSKDNDQL